MVPDLKKEGTVLTVETGHSSTTGRIVRSGPGLRIMATCKKEKEKDVADLNVDWKRIS